MERPSFRPDCQQEKDVAPCVGVAGSCAANEVWSYGSATQPLLEKYIRVRAMLKPYIAALVTNVTATGVPTVRPLWWEFPGDPHAVGVNDQCVSPSWRRCRITDCKCGPCAFGWFWGREGAVAWIGGLACP